MKSSVKSSKGGSGRTNGGSNTISAENDPVGQRLRDFFSAIEDEGIPDRFLDLLEKLDAAENAAVKPSDTPNADGAKDGR